jgi:hypothetical protein
MALVSLVYVSFASDEMSDEQLLGILTTARTKNQTLDVTGMLLYHERFFVQALEGEAEVVDELFEKIRTDPRHHDVFTVYKQPIEERTFKNWTMGFNKLDNLKTDDLPGFTDFLTTPHEARFFTENPSRAKMLLETFRDQTSF